MDGLIRVTPDRTRAKSILRMAKNTSKMIKTIDKNKFSSNVVKEYYDVIRELISIIVLLDGYKTYGEGAHKKLIEFFALKNKEFSSYEVSIINELRKLRNKIDYDGFFVGSDYIERKEKNIIKVLEKIIKFAEKRIC